MVHLTRQIYQQSLERDACKQTKIWQTKCLNAKKLSASFKLLHTMRIASAL